MQRLGVCAIGSLANDRVREAGVKAAQDEKVLADLSSLRNGRGKIYEIEFRDVLNLIDQGREGGLEFRERRVGQRFPYLLPLSLRQPAACLEGVGFTQDLSSRGVFFFTDAPLTEGSEIEITLRMPSEITLGESMPVRCRAAFCEWSGLPPKATQILPKVKRKSELRFASTATNISPSPPTLPPPSPRARPVTPTTTKTGPWLNLPPVRFWASLPGLSPQPSPEAFRSDFRGL